MRASGSWIVFSVTDTGIGIAPQNLNKLFQPFVQIDSSLNRRYNGTGLGLALVRQIAELHGGDISVRSELDQGSCFTLRIPNHFCSVLESEPLSQIPDQTFSGTPIGSTIIPAIPADWARSPLILLAEDNAANVEMIASYLESQCYRLILAGDGQAAIDLTKAQRPDLILMDIQMPDVDGLEAIRQIREQRELAHIPIIALTALAMSGDQEKCLQVGATEYLPKPVKLKQLASVIQQLLK
jgi:CheY-like chemotaxis protein